MKYFALIFFCIFSLHATEDPPSFAVFTPPKTWEIVSPETLPGHVVVSFVGKSRKELAPSINLAIEEISCSSAEYLKIVKNLNRSHSGNKWRDLGKFKTEAGEAHLSEIETKIPSGTVRLLQLIFVHDNRAYILTAGALKEEFARHYQEFEGALKSFSITKDLFSCITNNEKKEKLLEAIAHLKENKLSRDAFLNPQFQESTWIPFQNQFLKDSIEQGAYFQLLALQQIASQLLIE